MLMILSYEPDWHRVKVNQHVKYLGEGHFGSKLLCGHTHADWTDCSTCCYYYYIHLMALTWVSRHQKGKPFWILLEQEMMGWQWHQLDHMQIIHTALHTDNHASTSPLSYYSPDALSAVQPIASKHWRHYWLIYLHHKNATSETMSKDNSLECGPMPNAMVALLNICGALCSTPQSLADAHY